MHTDTDIPRSAAYLAAIDAHDDAIHLYDEARLAYRERRIGDAAFDEAARAYRAATAAFDVAFAAEARRG